jgi:hypothetical protein
VDKASFFILNIFLNSFLAFFTVAFLIESVIFLFRIRQGRVAATLRMIPIIKLPRKYTGVEDGAPDTKEAIAYRDFLRKSTKLDMTKTIESLSNDEFNILIKKMENYEGWHPWAEGEEYIPIQKVVGIKISNHGITSYLVLDFSEKKWISREEAISLAENRKLRAVVVHNKKYTYLRPFPHEPSFRDMIC